jgi:hypothetical protein
MFISHAIDASMTLNNETEQELIIFFDLLGLSIETNAIGLSWAEDELI